MTWYNYTNQETLNDLECNEPSTRRIRTPPRTRRSLLVDRETIIIVVPRSRHTRKAYLKLDNELHWPLQNVTLYIHTFPRLVKITSITSRIIVSGEEITVIRTLSSTWRSDVNRDEGNRRYRPRFTRHEKTVSRKRVGTRWTGCCRARSVCPEQASFPFATFPARTLPLSAFRRAKHTRPIYMFPLHPFPYHPRHCLSSSSPATARTREIPEFRASVAPPPPSQSAKSFFKLRLAAVRSETERQRGKKRSRREPLGLFPTSSAVQTRRTPKPRPLSTGSPSTLFRCHRFSGGIWLSLLEPLETRREKRSAQFPLVSAIWTSYRHLAVDIFSEQGLFQDFSYLRWGAFAIFVLL